MPFVGKGLPTKSCSPPCLMPFVGAKADFAFAHQSDEPRVFDKSMPFVGEGKTAFAHEIDQPGGGGGVQPAFAHEWY